LGSRRDRAHIVDDRPLVARQTCWSLPWCHSTRLAISSTMVRSQ